MHRYKRTHRFCTKTARKEEDKLNIIFKILKDLKVKQKTRKVMLS